MKSPHAVSGPRESSLHLKVRASVLDCSCFGSVADSYYDSGELKLALKLGGGGDICHGRMN